MVVAHPKSASPDRGDEHYNLHDNKTAFLTVSIFWPAVRISAVTNVISLLSTVIIACT